MLQSDSVVFEFKHANSSVFVCRTFKQDCGFNIYLAASKDGAHLEIRSLLLEHNNHTVSEHLFRHLPQQRRLPPDLQTKAASMLQLRANKKLLREQLEVQSNKAVTLRDLSNLAARKKQGCSRNDLEATVKLLQNKYASTVRLLTGENNELRAIFFQDDAMRRSFEDYPEIIFIDATYKLLETRMSCFLMLVEDGNGESEIVAVGLFGVEDGDTLRWFFNVFKELNKSWNSVKITMADKDLKERRIVTELLPQSSLHICAFHTLQTFRREISVQKLGITKPAQETALDILQHMVYAKDDDEYQRLHETLKSSSPKAV